MSQAGTSGEAPLLARKGTAAPAGMVVTDAADALAAKRTEPPLSAPKAKERPAEIGPSEAASADANQELPAAASLLPLDFAAAKFREADAGNLLRLEPAASSGAAAATRLQAEPRVGAIPVAQSRSGIGLGAWAAVIAVVAVAGLAVWRLSTPQPGPAPVAVREGPAVPERAVDVAPAAPRAAGDAGGEDSAAVARVDEAGEPAPEPATEPAAESGAVSADKAPSENMPQTAAAITPSVDIVDLQPDGSVVIAGRAAPESELIVLDGDEPIGTAKADAFGEWVLVPDRPLAAGEHAFGLVIKEVHGTVLLPAPESKLPAPEEPAASEQDQSQAPVPPRKPERSAAAVPDPAFVVQLASVKTRNGAVLEWEKLKARFPDLLADKKLTLDEAEVQGLGPVVRVRAGPFADHSGAADFCANIATDRQDCLVLRTDGGS